MNAAGIPRQKRLGIALTNFTKPGDCRALLTRISEKGLGHACSAYGLSYHSGSESDSRQVIDVQFGKASLLYRIFDLKPHEMCTQHEMCINVAMVSISLSYPL